MNTPKPISIHTIPQRYLFLPCDTLNQYLHRQIVSPNSKKKIPQIINKIFIIVAPYVYSLRILDMTSFHR